MVLKATPANMEALRKQEGSPTCAHGVFAFSKVTEERYSASPGDYFMRDQNECLKDSEGNDMYLAYEFTEILPAKLNNTD